MKSGYLWLATFVAFPLVGFPILKHRAFRGFGLACRIALAGGVGMVIVSWTMTVFALANARWGPPILLVSVAIALLIRRALRGARDGSSPPPLPGEGRGEGLSSPSPLRGEGRGEGLSSALALATTAVSVLAAFAATAAAGATSPDLLLFWGPKAQQFAAARTIDVAFLSFPFLEYLHVYYPPLVTNVFAFGAMIVGRFPWGAATLTFPLMLAATAIGLSGVLRTEAPRSAALSTTALAVSALSLLGIHASVAGNAEPFLLFFEAVALAVLLTPIARSGAGQLLAGLLLAGAASAKVEGLAFVGAAVLFFLLVEPAARRTPAGTLLRLVGPSALSVGTWLAFGALRKLFYGYQSYGRLLDVRWDHIDEVLSGLGSAFWKAGYALPFAVPLAVLLLTRGRTRRAWLPIGIAFVLAGFFTFTYLHSETDPGVWIGWSAARIFSPLTALLALAAHRSAPYDAGVPGPSV